MLTAQALGATAMAAEPPFGQGWDLDPEESRLTFQSVKNGAVVETSRFATLQGEIAPDGTAAVKVHLNSVDTAVDLRNVRMRFLFFETFKFPEAIVTTTIDAEKLAVLAERRRIHLPLDYVLDLHGVTQAMNAETIVTLIGDDRVSVASTAPIAIAVDKFDLTEGVLKLEEAAQVKITPVGAVSFDFVFLRRGPAPAAAPVAQAPAPAPPPAVIPVSSPASTALETSGEFSREACIGRFEILSRTGAIYFKSGSANLDAESDALLATLLDIVKRCPSLDVDVAGHTDDVGAESANQRLSVARAASVAAYLVANGVDRGRIYATGYGETRPVAPNDSDRNRGRNRRIEFSAAE